MIITSPETLHTGSGQYHYHPSATKFVFVAGGITGAPDWQKPFCEKIDSPFWIIANPRRKEPIAWEASAVAKEQIEWEYFNIKTSDIVIFWFPKEAKCMITLFELGKELGRLENATKPRRLIVGIEPGYERSFDILQQIGHCSRHIPIFDNLDAMADHVNGYKI